MFHEFASMEFNEEYVILIFYNILCSLNFLHNGNVIHRDIKSANLLIDDDCQIKVCDFGLSRTIVSDNNNNIQKNKIGDDYEMGNSSFD